MTGIHGRDGFGSRRCHPRAGSPVISKKETMKTKTATVIRFALSLTRSRWFQPALFSLIFTVAVLGVTGCTSHH